MNAITNVTIVIRAENVLQEDYLKKAIEKIEKSFEEMEDRPQVKIMFI